MQAEVCNEARLQFLHQHGCGRGHIRGGEVPHPVRGAVSQDGVCSQQEGGPGNPR